MRTVNRRSTYFSVTVYLEWNVHYYWSPVSERDRAAGLTYISHRYLLYIYSYSSKLMDEAAVTLNAVHGRSLAWLAGSEKDRLLLAHLQSEEN